MHKSEKKVKPVQIQRFLKGMDHPAKKKDLIETARRPGGGPIHDLDPGAASRGRPQQPEETSKSMGRLR